MTHQHEAEERDARQFWEDRYSERDRIWSGKVNPVLSEIVADLDVGTALDLGCGEGGDAVWLAGMGWRVTAVDISATALQRAEQAATERGVDGRITFARHDLATDFPSGVFDLVSAQFLQTPLEFPRAEVLQQAARAVAVSGRLLIVEHGAAPPWMPHDHDHPVDFPTPQQTFDQLELVDQHWRIERLEAKERQATGPNGETGTLMDNIILARRLA
ncbi:class I SAM-dependent methyltransferase [Microlunatus elymi]|uniref:Class I SAM-dependent methyltransferase n=1 Tax=Microlunatus elymi TaxID=2596828 RepID=A0A516Q095_9ACTN|nr:class I SAM-dependent methyltransferase [Microlunatus elymi]QDP96812.1 class I SAM-dependent methyltransferase [Microlunatus elymi]